MEAGNPQVMPVRAAVWLIEIQAKKEAPSVARSPRLIRLLAALNLD